MPYHLWMGNIVNIATDAIVNAANTELKRTPGTVRQFSPQRIVQSWRRLADVMAIVLSDIL